MDIFVSGLTTNVPVLEIVISAMLTSCFNSMLGKECGQGSEYNTNRNASHIGDYELSKGYAVVCGCYLTALINNAVHAFHSLVQHHSNSICRMETYKYNELYIDVHEFSDLYIDDVPFKGS